MTQAIRKRTHSLPKDDAKPKDERYRLVVAWGQLVSSVGPIRVAFSEQGVVLVRFAEEEEATRLDKQIAAGCRFREAWQRRTLELLERYFSDGRAALDEIPVDYRGLSVFRRRVMEACRAIPSGSTATYRQLAEAVGHPKAARAVGGVMRTNPVPLIVPCHRVIRCDGNLGGYSGPGGVVLKRRLLELESRGRCRSEPDT